MSEIYIPPKVAGDDERQAVQETVDERAAILEVEAGLSPREAQDKARLEVSGQQDPPAAEELMVENRFLNQWRDSIARSTDADGTLVLFAGVGLLSAVCHQFYFHAPRKTPLNLFLFILGPSSSPRKTTVLDMVRDYLAEVGPDLILPDQFTPEALFSCLSERSHGIVFSRELNSWLIQMLGKDYNRGLAPELGNIYDHTKCITRETKKDGLLIVQEPVINILGAGVDEVLFPYLKKIDQASGFWPRVTLVLLPPTQPGKLYRSPGEFDPQPQILEKLRAIVAQKEGGKISFEKIEPMRQEYAAQLQQEATTLGNSNLVAAYLRLEWILVKIAALLQLADYPESREIEPAAFYDAMTLVNYVKQHLPTFYGDHGKPDEEVELAARTLKFIKQRDENGIAWVPFREILQHSHAATARLGAALGRLLATEECEQTYIPVGEKGGRPGKAYRSVKQ
ncbi:MAG: DUF3987 domain-containing protein [Methanosarcinaceae archaeon]|nr:DUF3987 domain-containing protein [Methanosarcinaceae archaeon]